MGNYEQLKQSVSDVIKTNGNQEITGSILQNVLLTIISTVGANATFAGIATPATNPGTPDGPVFYLASEGGTYTNFGAIELQDGLSVLSWNGTWSSQQIFGVDDVPTAGSDNLVKSGSVTKILSEIIKPVSNLYPYLDLESGYMLDNGNVDTTLSDYYHCTYSVSPCDLFYIKNSFAGYSTNHHVIMLDSSNNVIGTLLKGNIPNVEDMIVVPNNVTKIVINYSGNTPTILRQIEQNVIPDVINNLKDVLNSQQPLNSIAFAEGYMLDNGTIDTSLANYYHYTYAVAPGDKMYFKNRFSGSGANHHVIMLDSSNNVIGTMFAGSIHNVEEIFTIPTNVTTIVVNCMYIHPIVNKILNTLIFSQFLQDQITLNEDYIKKQVELSYNNRIGGGFMANDGSIVSIANYYYQDYSVVEGDKIYLKNHFEAYSANQHVILLDSLDNVIGLLFQGSVRDIEEIFIIPPSVAKIVVNSTSIAPTVAKVYNDHIRSQYLQEQIDEMSYIFAGKKWALLGDSLTEVNSRTSKNYADYIHDKSGITLVNMGVSGTGYKKGEDNNKAFYQKALNVPTDADIITIFGSFNDLSVQGYDLGTPSDTSINTICGCFNKTLDNILSTFMNAGKVPVIGVITPTPWIGKTPSDPASTSSLYCDALIECCKRNCIPVLDLYRYSNLHPDNSTFRTIAYSHDDGNGVHPDERGHQIIASEIYEFIKKLLI